LLSVGNCDESVLINLARYCWHLQQRNQLCPIKQTAKESLVQLFSFQQPSYFWFLHCGHSPPSLHYNLWKQSTNAAANTSLFNKRGKRWFTSITSYCMEMKDLTDVCVVGDMFLKNKKGEVYEFRFILTNW